MLVTSLPDLTQAGHVGVSHVPSPLNRSNLPTKPLEGLDLRSERMGVGVWAIDHFFPRIPQGSIEPDGQGACRQHPGSGDRASLSLEPPTHPARAREAGHPVLPSGRAGRTVRSPE